MSKNGSLGWHSGPGNIDFRLEHIYTWAVTESVKQIFHTQKAFY